VVKFYTCIHIWGSLETEGLIDLMFGEGKCHCTY